MFFVVLPSRFPPSPGEPLTRPRPRSPSRQETAGEHILASVPRHAKANEALREAERSNAALKETLACTLANQEAEDGRPKLNIDSAANMILRLLDSLIMGGDVSVTDVLTVRDALLRGGTNLW